MGSLSLLSCVLLLECTTTLVAKMDTDLQLVVCLLLCQLPMRCRCCLSMLVYECMCLLVCMMQGALKSKAETQRMWDIVS